MDWLSPFKDRGFAQLGRTMRRLLTFFESEIANWRSPRFNNLGCNGDDCHIGSGTITLKFTNFFLAFVLSSALAGCVYRKPKPGRNGDEAHRESRVTRCSRPAERDETPVHLCPTTGVPPENHIRA
jgi:hypothetical protein